MNINASIIDQRLIGIQEEIRDKARSELNIANEEQLKSLSFVYLCVKIMLDLDIDEAFDCITDGGNDFGVDAIHITEDIDGEFTATIFQAKYKRNLEGDSCFPESGINLLINAIKHIFNPSSTVTIANDRLQAYIESARSMIRDGIIPRIRTIACNNGIKWNDISQEAIDRANFGPQVTWEHVNHDVLINVLQRIQPVNETLHLVGKATVEDMDYSRVCIGRMPVTAVAALMRRHGDRLLERNIRRYLGLHGNRVNEGIRETLFSETPSNFYFFNNGLTLICDHFNYNALQSDNYQVKVDNLQIVNGGQTCMTIFKTIEEMYTKRKNPPENASVLIRLYELPKDSNDLILNITHATNSQNPVDLKDLRSNDTIQQQLEIAIKDLDFNYRRKRVDGQAKSTDITSGTAAEAILAVWRHRPHQAKFMTREHFGKLYDCIFTNELNGAQTVCAVLLYRIAENHRRRPSALDPDFVRYASCFTAMQMGRRLLKEMSIRLNQLTHQNFKTAKEIIDEKGEIFFDLSVRDISVALDDLYHYTRNISMQQLSATFRRGDLIDRLRAIDV